MEHVGADEKTGLFLSSNNTQRKIPDLFLLNFLWTSVKTLVMEPLGPHGKTGPFSSSNEP
ncbi:hypothetical protein H5410_051852 [Solanum commersonii]|uniref:Uncharacterized protein n=1 Tax=Solanum commersonii TaxID=4109 RepID=A0A9J5WZ90_SOLCO|nr:hypothetical protein H5410_051852 [Solanum commersonii]